ncbi:MAG: RtcB family protein [Candidatus Diapherotrites archaeon]|nr:RtcB family protein [Candidatus Diapherotrites archaeon]
MGEIKKISEFIYEVPKEGNMRVPGRIYGNENTIAALNDEFQKNPNWNSLQQMENGAGLPGIQKYLFALADVHCGYGLPIGSVFAADPNEGVITFGGIGFDINCGVHSLIVPLKASEVEKKKKEIAEQLFRDVPAGLGSKGNLELGSGELDEVMEKGAEFVVERGCGRREELKFIEENGCVNGADPKNVSEKAKQRALRQIGTLGSGNHYCEIQEIEKIFDEEAAEAFGLEKEGVLVSIHCGSRALGHQIGTDYLSILAEASRKYKINIPDRELVCAPIESEEGQDFFSAVKCGMNAAFANRQAIASLVRRSFAKVFGISEAEVKTLYDVGHNTAKMERHKVNGKMKELLVQRKGSTRGFGPDRGEVPSKYRKVGQPVIVGGTMGTHSFILKGTEKAMEETFGSTIHGAGRAMSRTRALKMWTGSQMVQELEKKGILIKAKSLKGLPEEAPLAYKDVEEVVNIMHKAGISTKVAMVKPMVCVKG